MFYGAFVLAKKGPLAKVWLAAHWDKKLTKAHIFETDVEQTVDDIISPKVQMALRTSGHLLLGVVRIYSRKQKYLINDLGEACAKIRMAFRPGIVDLPPEAAVASTDTITLPEIFHDFETAVADLGSLEVEDQFTIGRSRASEITMAEETGPTAGDLFGEFGEFDLGGDMFGGEMEDAELPRKTIAFADEKDQTDGSITKIRDEATLREEPNKSDFTMEDQLPDRGDFGGGEFLEDGFGGFGDGGMLDMGPEPGISDINLEEGREEEAVSNGKEDAPPSQATEKGPEEVPMEVEQPPAEEEQPTLEQAADTTVVPVEEDGFVLEPVEVTATKKKAIKRKRKLVVDTNKELTSNDIRSQLESYQDVVQQKCFPPPTKKALLWKDMASCEQLFLRPTVPALSEDLASLICRNYSTKIPGAPADETLIDLEHDVSATADIEKKRAEDAAGDITVAETTAPEGDITRETGVETADLGVGDLGMVDDVRPFDLEGIGGDIGLNGDLELPEGEATTRVIPDMPSLTGISSEDTTATQTTEERQSEELSEDYEQRRWTKRTQQVLRLLSRGLSKQSSVEFSTLTQRCNRKQAASRFYTCLLLAKEGTIQVEQSQPYAEIAIQKGPKFTSTC